MPDDSEKQERVRTPDEQQLWPEREEEIAASSPEAELCLPRLKLINSDGRAVEPADWEGRRSRPLKIPDDDCGVSLLGAIRRIIAKGHDGDRLSALFAKKLAIHIYNTHAEARDAYDNSVDILRQGGAQNLIEADGFHEDTGTRSSITQGDWQTWEIDGWRNRLIDPADGTRTITNVWIKNVTSIARLRESVANATKPHYDPVVANKHDGSRSSANAKKQCQAWLVKLMKISPNYQPKVKGEYQKEAQALFKGLSGRMFIDAWAFALKKTEATGWSRPGRPKKTPHLNPRTN
jgi:hypothetical protein